MPLPLVSKDARKTIKLAYDELEQVITPQDARGFSQTTLDDVKKAILEIENQLAARRSLCNMRRLMPLFKGLEHYSESVNILCNGTPYLPWVWSPITLIIRIASDFVEACDQIIQAYSKIGACLGRFVVLDRAFSTNIDFQHTLAVFYADILQFHKNAYQFVRRSSWRILFITCWGRFERRFQHIIDNMKRHEKLVDLQANAQHISEARDMHEDIKSWREEDLEKIKKLNEKESGKQYESIVTWLKADESDQHIIYDAISSEGNKTAGTCAWALKNQKIRSWLQQKPDSSLLWLQGVPGSGKSVLTAEITRFMKASNMLLLQHFCSHRYASSTTYDQILRSLLLQFIRKDEDLIAHVFMDYVLGKQPPTVQALEKLLLKLFSIASNGPRKVKYIWVVIDGLNECETRKQTSVVNLINQTIGKASTAGGNTVCKVLLSSRPSPLIANRLRARDTISLSDERYNLKLAIRQYVSQRLQSLHTKLHELGLGPKEIEEIGQVITNKSDGMFLYARLVLDYLSSNIFFTGAEMRSSIDELPEELSDFYLKILTQVLVRLDARSVDRLKCIFGWIAFSKRPLKRMEFLSALTFSQGDSKAKNLVPSYVLDICGPLVEERPDRTLNFIHISVKEFLQSTTSNLILTEKEAIAEHCVSTITCLLSGMEFLRKQQGSTRYIRVIKGIHGLHVYATEFWTEYLLHYASGGGFEENPSLRLLAYDLAQKLDEFLCAPVLQSSRSESAIIDERLASLKDQPFLLKHVEESLRCRSLKRLESNILQEVKSSHAPTHHATGTSDGPIAPQNSGYSSGEDGISATLLAYQDIVRFLLEQDSYPGVCSADLDMFKSQFKNSAFTCRLSFCPRATLGFVSEESRRQHEMAHTRLIMCPAPECKYPPFTSSRALKSHLQRYHEYRPARRPIRPLPRPIGQEPISKKRKMVPDESEQRARDAKKTTRTEMRETGQTAPEAPEINEQRASTPALPLQWVSIEDGLLDTASFNPNEGDSMHVEISSMGFRACAISNCRHRLGEEELQADWIEHYWTWHHADSITRCPVHRCQMIFSNRQCLQDHYKQRHTVLLCHNCNDDEQDGFILEDELRQHWGSFHAQKVRGWMCAEPDSSGLLFGCEACRNGKKYGRIWDALEHLKKAHVNDIARTQPMDDIHLRAFITSVWLLFKAERNDQARRKNTQPEQWESEDDFSDDNKTGVDDMFYVEELA